MKTTRIFLAAALLAVLPGCATLVSNASSKFADNLGSAVLNSEDPATVRDGLPSYLLLLDSLAQPADADAATLLAAAKLNSAYAGNFTGDDKLRARRL
jgi:hypothetical protein